MGKTISWKQHLEKVLSTLKHAFIMLSAFCCLGAMVGWGLGVAGYKWGFISGSIDASPYFCANYHGRLVIVTEKATFVTYFVGAGYSSGLLLGLLEGGYGVSWPFPAMAELPPDRKIPGTEGIFVLPSFHKDTGLSGDLSSVFLPYWFFILAFGIAPVMWAKSRYVEHRNRSTIERADD